MSNPNESEPEEEEQRAVRSALDSWSRTARLCTIYLVRGVIPLAMVLPWLLGR
jgi:hypothetical protein